MQLSPRSATWLLLLLAATLPPPSQAAAARVPRRVHGPAPVPYVGFLPLPQALGGDLPDLSAPRAARVPREAAPPAHATDNDAEASDVDAVPAAQQQQQEYQYQEQEHQDAQEARHFSRRAEDNYEDEQVSSRKFIFCWGVVSCSSTNKKLL